MLGGERREPQQRVTEVQRGHVGALQLREPPASHRQFMAYIDLQISRSTPPLVKEHVIDRIEMLFKDVHVMLQSPFEEVGIEAGANFTIALALSAIVDGVSLFLFPRNQDGGDSFRRLIEIHYPWRLEGINKSTDRTERAEQIQYFRHNLVHRLGTDSILSKNRTVRYSRKHKVWAITKSKYTESVIEAVERSTTGNGPWAPTILHSKNGEPNLIIANFYRGIRRMVVDLTKNKEVMYEAEGFLRHSGFKKTGMSKGQDSSRRP